MNNFRYNNAIMDKLYRNITGLFAFQHLTPVGVVFAYESILILLGLLAAWAL